MSDSIITTKSGARVKIVRAENGLWQEVRDDGLLMRRSSVHAELVEHLRQFGDVIEPAVPGKPLIF